MDLLWNESGDLDISDNRIKFVTTSSQQIKQRLYLRLFTNKGEWKFNTDFGLPWITGGKDLQIISKDYKSFAEAVIRKTILETEGVVKILRFEFNIDKISRSGTIFVQVQIIDNTTIEIFEELF